jgi:carboxyl-terminal processing protease
MGVQRLSSSLCMKWFKTILFLFFALSVHGQSVRNFKQEAYLLRNLLNAQHVSPKPMDDTFSSEVFDAVFDELDPDKIFFSDADIQWLEPFRNKIDDELKGSDWIFMNRLKERYQSCLERAERSVNSFATSPDTWKTQESFDPDDDMRVPDETAILQKQKRWLKYEVLQQLAQLNKCDSGKTRDFFNKFEPQVVSKVKATQLRKVRQKLRDPMGFDNAVGLVFFHAITTVFDPHTLYLSATDVQFFMTELSTEKYYFGFTLGESAAGSVIISALAPGGPAWRSGELHVSDEVQLIKFENEEPIDLRGVDFDEVQELFDDNGKFNIELTIRTPEGLQKTVKLHKEKMESDENAVKSFVLKGERTIGYIYLPDFYTHWDDATEGARCANDVAKEIIKLRKDGIEGLILDVRFNGGGSLYEAIAMAGIFIDEGPLGIMKSRAENVQTLKDVNRGTVWDGPLVLMVNGHSASASEFLAAALQDYNRGIVVGSQTYGKGTGQNILPLDPREGSLKNSLSKGNGFVKVTTEKLYRVTGRSVQGDGLKPDVIVPDIFSVINIHESDAAFSLPKDSIIKNTYYKPLPIYNRDVLQSKSNTRVAGHPAFTRLQETMHELQQETGKENTPVQLNWNEISKTLQQENRQQAAFKSIYNSPVTAYEVKTNSAEATRMNIDEYARQYNDAWIKRLKSDIYVEETFQIVCDYINLNKKP